MGTDERVRKEWDKTRECKTGSRKYSHPAKGDEKNKGKRNEATAAPAVFFISATPRLNKRSKDHGRRRYQARA